MNKVEIGKEFPIALVFFHVTNGVNVDEKSHTSYYQHHDQREVVDEKRKRDIEAACNNPVK
jgi:hypothetical protein